MLKKFINASLMAISVLSAGCSSTTIVENIDFGERIHSSLAIPNDVVEVYFNRDGTIYPPRSIFFREGYNENYHISDWLYREATSQMRTDSKAWLKQQQHWAEIKAKEIATAADRQNNTELVIFIHGFRNTINDIDNNNKAVQKKVKNYLGDSKRPIFLSVMWDGRGPTMKKSLAWKMAQATGPLVGFSLRSILNALKEYKPNIPIRIITHSSGAFVAASLIGNPRVSNPEQRFNPSDAESYPTDCNEAFYLLCLYGHINFDSKHKFHSIYGVPSYQDLALLMLAPATTASAFAPTTGLSNKKGYLEHDGILMKNGRIIVGMNSRDSATKKYLGFESPFGSTVLGSNVNRYCKWMAVGIENMRNLASPNQRQINHYFFNFHKSKTNREPELLFWEKHALAAYIGREDMNPALDILFGNNIKDEKTKYCNL